MTQKCRAISAALVHRVYTNQWQIPVWRRGMITSHALEDTGHFLQPIRGQTLPHDRVKRLLVRVNAGWEPERSAAKPAHLVTGTMLKRPSAKCPHESREIGEVCVRIGVRPARCRIRA